MCPPPSSPDKKGVSFKRLMSLERIGDNEYVSVASPWSHARADGGARAFGGHVYAQAVYAASKTVATGMVLHNVTGHFILPGRTDVPFTYRMRRIRDGAVYSVRSVEAYQPPAAESVGGSPSSSGSATSTPCFVATVSFKRAERAGPKTTAFSHQDTPADHLRRTYRSVLAGKPISAHPASLGADGLWGGPLPPDGSDTMVGVEVRKVDMHVYNDVAMKDGGGNAGAWRQLCFYRVILDEDDEKEHSAVDGSVAANPSADAEPPDLNLDACAHLYASDRNSLFLIQRALGYDRRVSAMASLSHTVIFHGAAEHVRQRDSVGRAKWFVQEAWTSNSGASRGCHESRLWEWERGLVVATTVQDGMVRIMQEERPLAMKSREERL